MFYNILYKNIICFDKIAKLVILFLYKEYFCDFLMNSNYKNNINFIYQENIEDIKRHKDFISSNIFIVSSYNYNKYLNYENYNGTSYELYYVSNDKEIHQLTYCLIEGNGVLLKDNEITINIDNESIQSLYNDKNNSYYISVNSKSFKDSSFLSKGLVSVDNNLYYNDNYYNQLNLGGAFKFIQEIDLSSGFVSDMQLLNFYYNNCIAKMEEINNLYNLCLIKIGENIFIKVGDILYYDNIENKYTANRYNKDGKENSPEMVCVISSNVLDDRQPRFIKIKRNSKKYIFDKSSSIYVKSTFKYVPNYNTNQLSYININTSIVNSTYGFIATNNINWENNYINPLNNNEHYYISSPEQQVYKTNILYDRVFNIPWYCDCNKINFSNYEIEANGIFTNILDSSVINKYENQDLTFSFYIKYNNDRIKKYKVKFKLENNRLINDDIIKPYNTMLYGNIYNSNISFLPDNGFDLLESTYITTKNNVTLIYIVPNDSTRNIELMNNNLITTNINNNSEFANIKNQINISRININIGKNICNMNCYMKISLILQNNKTYSEYYIKYDNSKGINYLLEDDIDSNKITSSSYIKISCYQISDFSDSKPYNITPINIIYNSRKSYTTDKIIFDCNVSANIYNFAFENINVNINIDDCTKEYWDNSNNITDYLNLNTNAILLNKYVIVKPVVQPTVTPEVIYTQPIVNPNNYWIDLSYCKLENNKFILKNNGIVIDLTNNSNYTNIWSHYDSYYLSFNIIYQNIFGEDTSTAYTSTFVGIFAKMTNKKIVLATSINIPKNCIIVKFIVYKIYGLSESNTSIYYEQKDLTNYANLTKQGDIKNYSSIEKQMNTKIDD